MSECEYWGGSCMVSHESGDPGAEQPVCCDALGSGAHFSDLYRFVPTDTHRHQCCFVAVRNTTGRGCGDLTELNDGLDCGYGCRMCDDLKLDMMVDYLDGKRWLRAEQRGQQRYWDARGLIHDLRSNEYHPIPGSIMYERGSCWENEGRECFQEDACVCFGANVPEYPGFKSAAGTDPDDALNCSEAHEAGDPIGGLFPDPVFRTGYRWPPGTMAGMVGSNRQGMEQLYCRKFQDTRFPFDAGGGHDFTRVLVSPTKSGGLSGFTEPMFDPILLSSNACNTDRMVGCTARMATQSPCVGHSAWDELLATNPDASPALSFYNQDQPSRARFNYLSINGDNTVHIRGAEDTEGLAGPTAKWKNTVLEMIRTGAFQFNDPDFGIRTLNFDRLDHQHSLQQGGNLFVGVYRREWDAEGVFPVDVPNGSGTGRLRMSGCLFDYKTVLTHVKIECRLILPQVKEWGDYYYIEPLARIHIIGVVSVLVSNVRSGQIERGIEVPCGVDSWHTGRDRHHVYLDVHNRMVEGGSIPEIWASERLRQEDGRLDPPKGSRWDQDESLMFFDSDGKQFLPGRFVEWRGMLGGHSNPSAEHQRFRLEYGGGSCGLVVERFNGHSITIPGWPTHTESNPDDPQQVYGGHIKLEFS